MFKNISDLLATAAIEKIGDHLPEIKKLALDAVSEFVAKHEFVVSIRPKGDAKSPKKANG